MAELSKLNQYLFFHFSMYYYLSSGAHWALTFNKFSLLTLWSDSLSSLHLTSILFSKFRNIIPSSFVSFFHSLVKFFWCSFSCYKNFSAEWLFSDLIPKSEVCTFNYDFLLHIPMALKFWKGLLAPDAVDEDHKKQPHRFS